MATLAVLVLLAISRAELIERFKAPVVTQAEGMVRVYASCPEDMRREFQMPIARFAADTVNMLYRGLAIRPSRVPAPGIAIYVGDVRTNDTTVVARAVTNDAHVVTRIYVRAPGYADLARLRIEVIKGFYRRVKGVELSDDESVAAYYAGDPEMRQAVERNRLEEWLATGRGVTNDEEGIKLMRKVISPGFASPRDVLIFASRLYFYPPQHDLSFVGGRDSASFREAVEIVGQDPRIRMLALAKAQEIAAFGGGRGKALGSAADAYVCFLVELAKGKKSEKDLRVLLDAADLLLESAFEQSEKGLGSQDVNRGEI